MRNLLVAVTKRMVESMRSTKSATETLRIFNEFKAKGGRPDVCMFNVAIDSCKFEKNKEQSAACALSLFSEIKRNSLVPDLASYSSLIQVLGRAHHPQVWTLLDEMQQMRIRPDIILYASMLDLIKSHVKSIYDSARNTQLVNVDASSSHYHRHHHRHHPHPHQQQLQQSQQSPSPSTTTTTTWGEEDIEEMERSLLGEGMQDGSTVISSSSSRPTFSTEQQHTISESVARAVSLLEDMKQNHILPNNSVYSILIELFGYANEKEQLLRLWDEIWARATGANLDAASDSQFHSPSPASAQQQQQQQQTETAEGLSVSKKKRKQPKLDYLPDGQMLACLFRALYSTGELERALALYRELRHSPLPLQFTMFTYNSVLFICRALNDVETASMVYNQTLITAALPSVTPSTSAASWTEINQELYSTCTFYFLASQIFEGRQEALDAYRQLHVLLPQARNLDSFFMNYHYLSLLRTCKALQSESDFVLVAGAIFQALKNDIPPSPRDRTVQIHRFLAITGASFGTRGADITFELYTLMCNSTNNTPDPPTLLMILSTLSQAGDRRALQVYDEVMRNPRLSLPDNSLEDRQTIVQFQLCYLRACVQLCETERVLEFHDQYRSKNIRRNDITLAPHLLLLEAAINDGRMRPAIELLEQMEKWKILPTPTSLRDMETVIRTLSWYLLPDGDFPSPMIASDAALLQLLRLMSASPISVDEIQITAERVFEGLKTRHASDGPAELTLFYNTLLQTLLPTPLLSWASKLEAEMRERHVPFDLDTYNLLILLSARQRKSNSLALYLEMATPHEHQPTLIQPDLDTLCGIMLAMVPFDHNRALVAMRRICSEKSLVADARIYDLIFSLGFRDIIALRQKDFLNAMKVYMYSRENGVFPLTSRSYRKLLYLCYVNNKPKEALVIYEDMIKHVFTKTTQNTQLFVPVLPDVTSSASPYETVKMGEVSQAAWHFLLATLAAAKNPRVFDIFTQFSGIRFSSAVTHPNAADDVVDPFVFTFQVPQRFTPTSNTYDTLLLACHRLRDTQTAVEVVNRMRIDRVPLTRYSYAVMIRLCIKHEGVPDLDRAFQLFDHMQNRAGIKPSSATYNALMAVCISHTATEKRDMAWELFDKMRADGIPPDENTYTILLGACASYSSDGNRIRALMADMRRRGLPMMTETYNALIRLCIADKDSKSALKLLEQLKIHQRQSEERLKVRPTSRPRQPEIASASAATTTSEPSKLKAIVKERDIVRPTPQTYSILISVFVAADDIEGALRVFEEMKSTFKDTAMNSYKMFQPDERIYIQLISVCMKKKDLRQVQSLVSDMKRNNIDTGRVYARILQLRQQPSTKKWSPQH